MTSFFFRSPKGFVLLAAAASLTLLSGCIEDDGYAGDYWARPNYSYARNAAYDRAHADHIHSLCRNVRDRTRQGSKCYVRLHHRELNYGFARY